MPLSVPAAISVRANPNARTSRPSNPVTGVHFAPPSVLINAPVPRVPARTSSRVNGLNMIVVTATRPGCTLVQVEPPSVDRSSEPGALPAINTWLFAGSTASAKTGDCPCCGSTESGSHVESGSVPAMTPALTMTTPNNAASVAARRRLESDTSLPIITQAGLWINRGRSLISTIAFVLARAGAWLDRAAFHPASLPDDLTVGIALAPPVAAGLIIFKLPAVEMLGAALAFGAAGQLLAFLLWRRQIPRPQASPLIAAVFGVAFVGAGAPLGVTIAVAA